MRVLEAIVECEKVTCEGVYAGTWMNYTVVGGETHVFKAGQVVRMSDWHAFPDAVILGFNSKGNAKLARPYVYASSVGTTCATPLAGVEIIEYVTPENLVKYWTMIDTGLRIT